MKNPQYAWLVFRALCELARYEAIMCLRGFGCVQKQLSRQCVAEKPAGPDLERAICDAILLATCLYWKPVLCLQRSVCAVRLLRKHGVLARLAIGYRPVPFFSHAWVEVDGRVVNSSPAYQEAPAAALHRVALKVDRALARYSALAYCVAGNPACRRPFRPRFRYATNFSGFAALRQ